MMWTCESNPTGAGTYLHQHAQVHAMATLHGMSQRFQFDVEGNLDQLARLLSPPLDGVHCQSPRGGRH